MTDKKLDNARKVCLEAWAKGEKYEECIDMLDAYLCKLRPSHYHKINQYGKVVYENEVAIDHTLMASLIKGLDDKQMNFFRETLEYELQLDFENFADEYVRLLLTASVDNLVLAYAAMEG